MFLENKLKASKEDKRDNANSSSLINNSNSGLVIGGG